MPIPSWSSKIPNWSRAGATRNCWWQTGYMPSCTEFKPRRMPQGKPISPPTTSDSSRTLARSDRMQRTIILKATLVLLIGTLSVPLGAQKRAKQEEKERAANLPALIWRDPGDVKTLNLFYGAGGKEHAPDPQGKFTFLKEDLKQTSPKFDVEDKQGVRWRIKLGQEPQAETAATRLLWAAGYFVRED